MLTFRRAREATSGTWTSDDDLASGEQASCKAEATQLLEMPCDFHHLSSSTTKPGALALVLSAMAAMAMESERDLAAGMRRHYSHAGAKRTRPVVKTADRAWPTTPSTCRAPTATPWTAGREQLGNAVLRVKRDGNASVKVKPAEEGSAVSILGNLLKGSFQGFRLIRSYS